MDMKVVLERLATSAASDSEAMVSDFRRYGVHITRLDVGGKRERIDPLDFYGTYPLWTFMPRGGRWVGTGRCSSMAGGGEHPPPREGVM